MRDPDTLAEVIDAALGKGYRLIGVHVCVRGGHHSKFQFHLLYADTAAVYRNEELIAEALKKFCPKHSLKPEDIFVTSKLGEYI